MLETRELVGKGVQSSCSIQKSELRKGAKQHRTLSVRSCIMWQVRRSIRVVAHRYRLQQWGRQQLWRQAKQRMRVDWSRWATAKTTSQSTTWEASSSTSPRGKSPSGRMSRWPCKDYLRGTCNNSFCEKWHPPECLFYKTKSGCRFGEKCAFAHRQVDEQPTKRSKTNNDKSAVAMLKKGNWQERESVTDGCHDRRGKPGKRGDKKLGQNSSKRQSSDARQLGCVFQDMTPPKSILRKSTDMPKPIQRVKFTKAIARHTKIRDQKPLARLHLSRCTS